ncbi:hypothetical protein FDA94_24980 [Herbidospora galbida]|uniref:Uncharacterized protein n=1 Tax=Herbidospora galbida TaxID=2575442 RepID=A0A4U3MD15_9ACTN|nr:hypothetical protein [Herbidospora galbida]TKK85647.1 hypothetical protein FDA94_24980 [Herbidospora galbida]
MTLRDIRNRVRGWLGLRPVHGPLIELALNYVPPPEVVAAMAAETAYLRGALARWTPEIDDEVDVLEKEAELDDRFPPTHREYLQLLWESILWPSIERRDTATLTRISGLVIDLISVPGMDYLESMTREVILESLGFYYGEIHEVLPEELKRAAERYHGPNSYSPAADPNAPLFPNW